MMTLATGCGLRLSGGVGADCTAFRPIYFSEAAIAALMPFRAEMEQVAGHNATWEERCG